MTNYYNKDLYKTLNINFDATLDEIKSAYRKLVRIYHPDVSKKSGNEEIFKEIQEAYEILSDDTKRRKYDVLHGFYTERIKKERDKKKTKVKDNYADFVKEAKKEYQEVQSDEEQKPETFTETINEALDNLFYGKKLNNKGKKSEPAVDGSDIQLDLNLSYFEAVNGTNKKVNILHTEPCTNCNGRKFINGSACPKCNGEGETSLHKKINVQIPKGVKTGSKVRIANEGNKGINGGKDGNLYLNIIVNKNPYFEIDGNNILCNLPVTPFEAALGAEIPINTQDGTITVKIPPATSSGQKLKIAQQGLENKTKTKRGDIIINIQIKMPDNLSEEEKALYEQLKTISKSDVRKDFNNAK